MYIFIYASLSFLVQHITCAPLSYLVHHSYASYIKTLYCIVLLISIYKELFIILTWYQSHCSKCFVQFFVFPGVLTLPQSSPVLLCRCRQNSGVPATVKGWIHRQRLTAFIKFFAPILRSKHLNHHWIDLLTPDLVAQKSPPSNVALSAWRFYPPSRLITRQAPASATCHLVTTPHQP